MSTPSFKYGNGVWATKEGSSLAYNDDNGHYKPLPFSVSRASSATRVNKQGLIEVVGNDRLRIDYSESTKGVALLEPSRSNVLPYSEEFDNAGWNKSLIGTGSTPVVTANQGLAPDGTMTADRIVLDLNGGTTTGDGSFLSDTATVSSAATVSLTIYLKSNTGLTQNLILWEAFTGTSKACIVTNEWQRFNVIATVPSTSSGLNFGLRNAFGVTVDDTADILAWGAQLEEGSYATSYIPTSGSTATRQADVANGAGVANVFNDSEGVLFADIAALADDLTFRAISISDGTINNRVTIRYRTISNVINCLVSGSTTTVFNDSYSVTDITDFAKVALKYKSGDIAVWINGFEATNNPSTFTISGLDTASFDRAEGVDDFYGKAKAINAYQTALTDAELEYLTSYRSLAEMATELNLNAL